MKTCSIEGCGRAYEARGWCDTHYARWKRNGDPLGLKIADRGNAVNPQGYKVYAGKREHTALAERVLGKPLPRGVVVHHVDENRLNNSPDNLLICTRGYHMLIHARMRARDACGNPNWRQCQICRRWDDPSNLYIACHGGTCYHKACRAVVKAKPLEQWAAHKGSKSGLLGAHWRSKGQRWEAVVKHEKRSIYLGSFATAEEANAAYMQAKAALKAGQEVPGCRLTHGTRLEIKA